MRVVEKKENREGCFVVITNIMSKEGISVLHVTRESYAEIAIGDKVYLTIHKK